MTSTAKTSADDGPVGRPPRRKRSRVLRVVTIMLGVLVILGLVGAVTQVLLERRDAAAHPAPGEFVALPDGRSLHLQVSGEGDGPVIVLEAGASASSSSWAWIQPRLSERYQVVSYDRAGLGWSDPSTHGSDVEPVVGDLHAALDERGLDGPYVLVGHSLGGHYARAFAAAYPDEVVGLVLVDPSHERQGEAVGEDYLAGLGPMMTALELAARVGLTRVYNPMAVELGLPEPQRSQIQAEQRSVQWVRSARREITALDRIGAQVAGQDLGDIPLRVLNAGKAPNADGQEQVDAILPLRQELAETLSTRGQAVLLPEAEHITIVTEQEFAAQVADAVIEVADLAAADAATQEP